MAVIVLCLFLTVLRVGLQCVIVVFFWSYSLTFNISFDLAGISFAFENTNVEHNHSQFHSDEFQ